MCTWKYAEIPISKEMYKELEEMYKELEEEFVPKSDRYGHENDFCDAELMEELREHVPKLKKPSDLPWGVARLRRGHSKQDVIKAYHKYETRFLKIETLLKENLNWAEDTISVLDFPSSGAYGSPNRSVPPEHQTVAFWRKILTQYDPPKRRYLICA